jgi:membrane-bound lytic murein transglycosylase D
MAQEFGPERKGREVVMYRVGARDTLGKVAKQFAVDVEDLARDNGLEPDAKLREGALLKLMVDRKKLERWGRKGDGSNDEGEVLGSEHKAGSSLDAARGSRSEPSDKAHMAKKGSHKSS